MPYVIVFVAGLVFVTSAEGLEPYRFTGRLNSILPTQGLVFVADVGDGPAHTLVPVVFRNADIVRVSRRVDDRWKWQMRQTRLHRWPAGTFVVVTGHRDASGVVWADRIEIPKPDTP